jgi:hypothetical protein
MERISPRTLCAALVLACAAAHAQVPEGTLEVGLGVYGMRMYVIPDSVHREGSVIRYELRGVAKDDQGFFRGIVRVDCERRLRAEERSTYKSDATAQPVSTTHSNVELRPVYEGTRQAAELERVCLAFVNIPEVSGAVTSDAAVRAALDEQQVMDAWDWFESGLSVARDGDRRGAINRIGAGLKLHSDLGMWSLLANLAEADGSDDIALIAWKWVYALGNAEEKQEALKAVGRLQALTKAGGKK